MLLGMFFAGFVYSRAIARKRKGAVYSVYSTIVILIVFCMKTMAYLNIIEEIVWISMAGQLIFFLFQALILSQHFTESWRHAKKEAEEADIFRSNWQLCNDLFADLLVLRLHVKTDRNI